MGLEAKSYRKLDLAGALQNGDREAFKQIFDEHYRNLVLYANKFVMDSDAACDLVQDVFVYLWEKRQNINIDRSLSSWLFRAVRNASINYLKKSAYKEDYIRQFLFSVNDAGLTSSPGDNALERVIHNELAEKIEAVIASLPEQCRNIFRMSRFRGMKNREIAEIYSISVRTVETQIYRALKVLKNSLKPHLCIPVIFPLISRIGL